MLNYRNSLFACAVLLLCIVSTSQVRANLITNGDFETPIEPAGSEAGFAGGSTAITGWIVLGHDVLILRNDTQELGNGIVSFNAQSGVQSVDLTGSGNTGPTDGLSQTIATVIGTRYLVSFSVGAALSNNGSAVYQLPGATDELSLNGGATLIPFSSTPVTPGFVTWTSYTYPFTATASSTTVSFFNGTALNTAEGGLDNVSVNAVPEPVSLSIVGLAGALLIRRCRRQNRLRSGCYESQYKS